MIISFRITLAIEIKDLNSCLRSRTSFLPAGRGSCLTIYFTFHGDYSGRLLQQMEISFCPWGTLLQRPI